jgi:hypothetical protein
MIIILKLRTQVGLDLDWPLKAWCERYIQGYAISAGALRTFRRIVNESLLLLVTGSVAIDSEFACNVAMLEGD